MKRFRRNKNTDDFNESEESKKILANENLELRTINDQLTVQIEEFKRQLEESLVQNKKILEQGKTTMSLISKQQEHYAELRVEYEKLHKVLIEQIQKGNLPGSILDSLKK